MLSCSSEILECKKKQFQSIKCSNAPNFTICQNIPLQQMFQRTKCSKELNAPDHATNVPEHEILECKKKYFQCIKCCNAPNFSMCQNILLQQMFQCNKRSNASHIQMYQCTKCTSEKNGAVYKTFHYVFHKVHCA